MIKIIMNIKYYILVFLGLILFLTFMYMNFIKTRLPREIPFSLTGVQFWLLIYICGIYIYVIKTLLYLKPRNSIFYKILSYMALPFIYFDSFIKYNKYYYPYYYKNFINLTLKLTDWGINENIMLIYILQIFPRMILISILIVDIFWLHHIKIFYYFIFLGLFPLFYRYLQYSLEFALEQSIMHLENKYDDIWIVEEDYTKVDWERNDKAIHHDTYVSIRDYLKIQYEALLSYGEDEEYIEYKGIVFAKEETYKQYRINNNMKKHQKLTNDDYENICVEYNVLMPSVKELYFFLENNKRISEKYYIPQMKITINLAYLICWGYILIISFHTLHFTVGEITFISSFQDNFNPFSDTFIKNNQL